MKKRFLIMLLILIMSVLTSCGSATIDVNELASKLAQNGSFAEELTEVSADITLRRYGIDSEAVEECAAYAGTMAVVDEVAVFHVKDAAAVEECVEKHIEAQKESYADYRPDEVPKLDKSLVKSAGDYIIVCVSEDYEKADSIISEFIK